MFPDLEEIMGEQVEIQLTMYKHEITTIVIV